jgi:hypothetical protein
MARKPIGIMLLVALEAIVGIMAILWGIYFLWAGTQFLSGQIDRLYWLMIVLVSIGTGGIGIYIAKGLWDLKDWGRTTTLILLAFAFIGSIGGTVNGNLISMIILITSVAFIFYLTRKETKAYFSESCQPTSK